MRRPHRLLIAVAVVLVAVASAPVPAHAQVDLLACTASSNVTFDPGLLVQERTTHVKFQVGYSNCTSTSSDHQDIDWGTRSGEADTTRGCGSLPDEVHVTFTITWNTDETSTVAGTTGGTDVGGQTVHTITGTVTGGEFTGAAFVEPIAQVNLNPLQCLAEPGVTSQTGLGELHIT